MTGEDLMHQLVDHPDLQHVHFAIWCELEEHIETSMNVLATVVQDNGSSFFVVKNDADEWYAVKLKVLQ